MSTERIEQQIKKNVEVMTMLQTFNDYFDEIENIYKTFDKNVFKLKISIVYDTFKAMLYLVQKIDNEDKHLFKEPMEKAIKIIDLLNTEIIIKDTEEEAVMTNEQKFELLKKEIDDSGNQFYNLVRMTKANSIITVKNEELMELTKVCWESYIKTVLDNEKKIEKFKLLGMVIEKVTESFELTESKKNKMIDLIGRSVTFIMKCGEKFDKELLIQIIRKHMDMFYVVNNIKTILDPIIDEKDDMVNIKNCNFYNNIEYITKY
jgi:hypothetical protein